MSPFYTYTRAGLPDPTDTLTPEMRYPAVIPLTSQIETARLKRQQKRDETAGMWLALVIYGVACICLGYLASFL